MSDKLRITTPRMELIAAIDENVEADMAKDGRLTGMLGARVPDNWPPQTSAHALPVFLDQLRERPDLRGWLLWYWVLKVEATGQHVLIGSGGFKGAPDTDGSVEIGYAVLPQYHGQGYATEAVRALIGWAFTHPEVYCIKAETLPENRPSVRVLEKVGFHHVGPGSEAGCIAFELSYCDYEPRTEQQ